MLGYLIFVAFLVRRSGYDVISSDRYCIYAIPFFYETLIIVITRVFKVIPDSNLKVSSHDL